MFTTKTLNKFAAVAVLMAILLPSTTLAGTLFAANNSFIIRPTVKFGVGVSRAIAPYVNMYKVTPVGAGVYAGTLVSTKKETSEAGVIFNVPQGAIVNFVAFSDPTKARKTTTYTFTSPPYKNFNTGSNNVQELCQINYTDVNSKMQSNGSDSCATSLGLQLSDQYVAVAEQNDAAAGVYEREGSFEVMVQENSDPLSLVRNADVYLYAENPNEMVAHLNTGSRGIATFIIESGRPFYFAAFKNGKQYGGRVTPSTTSPRVFVLTSDKKHIRGYYDNQTTSVMRLGAYPNAQASTGLNQNVLQALSPVETCVPFNAAIAQVVTLPEHPGYFFLTGFRDYSKAFKTRADAEKALAVAKQNSLTQECTMSVPGTKDVVEYWLTAANTAPAGNAVSNAGEDVINFNLANVTIEKKGENNYTLVEHLAGGAEHLIATKSTLAAAQVMKSVWDKYGFNEIGFVGRPGPMMTYYKHRAV